MAESPKAPLRAGVIGAGVFGGYHAAQYGRQSGVSLCAVLDHDPLRANAVAEPLGGKGVTDLAAFLAVVDVVTVASPGTVHAEQALAAIAAGKPVYVEKPLATTLADGRAILEAARAAGLTVACGHQERVIFRAMGLLDVPEQPLRLEAIRHGPASHRSQDVSGVLDLMVHDIDLAITLSAAQPETVQATGSWDVLQAEVGFSDGFVAVFDISRQAPARHRTMRIVYPSGEVEIDFIARTFRNTTPFALDADFAATPAASDPLGASVAGFLDAVMGRAPRPVVTGEEALAALEVALRVEAAAGL